MCIIMSLNVNEIELKDPVQKDLWLAVQREKEKGKKRLGKNVKAMFICGSINI